MSAAQSPLFAFQPMEALATAVGLRSKQRKTQAHSLVAVSSAAPESTHLFSSFSRCLLFLTRRRCQQCDYAGFSAGSLLVIAHNLLIDIIAASLQTRRISRFL